MQLFLSILKKTEIFDCIRSCMWSNSRLHLVARSCTTVFLQNILKKRIFTNQNLKKLQFCKTNLKKFIFFLKKPFKIRNILIFLAKMFKICIFITYSEKMIFLTIFPLFFLTIGFSINICNSFVNVF